MLQKLHYSFVNMTKTWEAAFFIFVNRKWRLTKAIKRATALTQEKPALSDLGFGKDTQTGRAFLKVIPECATRHQALCLQGLYHEMEFSPQVTTAVD
jgi:hypothetical protein